MKRIYHWFQRQISHLPFEVDYVMPSFDFMQLCEENDVYYLLSA